MNRMAGLVRAGLLGRGQLYQRFPAVIERLAESTRLVSGHHTQIQWACEISDLETIRKHLLV